MNRLGASLIALIVSAGTTGFAQPMQPTLARTIPAAGYSGPTVRLTGQTPIEVLNGAATRESHYDAAQMLRLAVVLALPHREEERQFLEDVQNRQSPLFHHFLSAAEWNARFGPTAEAEQAVVDWATSQGLTVTHRYDNRLAVDLEAPAGTIEKALELTINRYQLPAADGLEARTVYANDRNPAVPASLSGVVDAVLGLNSIEVARPGGGSGRLTPQPDYMPGPPVKLLETIQRDASPEDAEPALSTAGVTPPKSGYWQPTDMWSSSAYDYQALMNQGHCCNPLNNPTDHTPRETTIAIAAFGDVAGSDIMSFQQAFPYLAVHVQKIGIDGGYTCNNAKSADDNCVEVSMDTEWSLAMANSKGSAAATAMVYVYEGSGYSNAVILDVYNHMLSDAHARVMSTSWGWAENTQYSSNPEMDTYNATMKSVDNVLSSMAGQGWTLVASSGDNGAPDGCGNALRVDYPASDPNVVGAGGTELNEGSTSSTYEVAWTGGTGPKSCVSNHGGSGGGASEYWTAPSYQSGMGFSMRAVPDLSLDTYYGHDVYFNGGWHYDGGTSVAAPMLAGFFAQENAYLLAIGNKCGSKGTSACAPLGNANYAIYEEGLRNNAGRSPFYDIVSGCNSNDITVEYNLTAFCAKKGYDQVTGWGSANMLQLAWAVNWEVIPATGVPYVTFTGTLPATHKWYNSNQTVNWKINDFVPKGGTPGTGIAGETQGWDSLPAEPGSEPHGGSGNMFYSGPQFPNASSGCLAFVDNGCSGGASQGCHTVYVRGWNNQGFSTAGNASFPETYGPLCYDTVVPVTTATPGIVFGSTAVKVTLSASDAGSSNGTGSGVSKTYYSIDSTACTASALNKCTVYARPFTISVSGSHTVRYFSVDVAGNIESQKSLAVNVR